MCFSGNYVYCLSNREALPRQLRREQSFKRRRVLTRTKVLLTLTKWHRLNVFEKREIKNVSLTRDDITNTSQLQIWTFVL